MTPEDQALIDRINADLEKVPGGQRLWAWFGLGRDSFAVLPRVLMHAMPDDWQKRCAVLLEEFEEAFPGLVLETRVIKVENKKLVKWPTWFLNYRRPDMGEINKVRSKP